jgi:hypothetical protein
MSGGGGGGVAGTIISAVVPLVTSAVSGGLTYSQNKKLLEEAQKLDERNRRERKVFDTLGDGLRMRNLDRSRRGLTAKAEQNKDTEMLASLDKESSMVGYRSRKAKKTNEVSQVNQMGGMESNLAKMSLFAPTRERGMQ